MGLFGWILYLFCGVFFFVILLFLQNRYALTKLERFIFSLILMMVVAGICTRYGFHYTDNIFLIFVFLMITDVIYTSYFVERDFFDKDEKNIHYYIALVVVGFFLNQEFINRVTQVFLTGEDLRLVLWSFVILFVYSFCRNKNIFTKVSLNSNKYMSQESILVSYAKLKYKYYDDCDVEPRELSNLLYAIMIFQNSRRSKVLRNYDNFMFRIKGDKRKLGIMQVESNQFITDSESIALVYQKLSKLALKNSKSKTVRKKDIEDIIRSYDKENADYIQYIFDIIKKF